MALNQVFEAHDGAENRNPNSEDDDGPVLDVDPGWTIYKEVTRGMSLGKKNTCFLVWDQSDQIGQFLKALLNRVTSRSSPNI